MSLDFDLVDVNTVEFGVGYNAGREEVFCFVPVDIDVQNALRDMTELTWRLMQEQRETLTEFEPSEKYGNTEYVFLPLASDLATRLRDIHQAHNLPVDHNGLTEPDGVFCYFARLTDSQGRRLTALRRATHFKGVLKSRLISFRTDALKIVADQVFKLDQDFDLLVDTDTLHILRPSSFEFAGKIQSAILAAVPYNIDEIRRDLEFVDFSGIAEYAITRPRAARYLASIRSRRVSENIEKSALQTLCINTGVEFNEDGGAMIISEGHVMGFLEVLDRRRYSLELVPGSPERFRAASRIELTNGGR